VINRSVARRYARALLDLEEKQPTETAEKLSGFARLMKSNKTLAQVLVNPAFSMEERSKVLGRILKELGWGPPVDRFFHLLVERRRISYIEAIAQEFSNMVDEIQGIVRVKVESAHELGDEPLAKMKNVLATALDKKVIIERKVEPKLIAGVAVRIGSLVVDGTMKSQIARLRESLARTRT